MTKKIIMMNKNHSKISLWMKDEDGIRETELVLLEYKDFVQHYTEGWIVVISEKSFEHIGKYTETIPECMDRLRDVFDPFSYLDYDLKKEDRDTVRNSFNVNSLTMKLI